MHIISCLDLFIFLLLIAYLSGAGTSRVNKLKRKVDHSYLGNDHLQELVSNSTSDESERGFLPHGGLFTLGKVLNFFPVGGERECRPSEYTVARAGICLNPYDCRQRDGKAAGDCAHGLGVCCIFEVTCGGTVQNNLTYFMSPGFPELWTGERDCAVTVHKTHAGIAQLRIDFVHFTIGQPNRMTGECNEDVMMVGEGSSNFTVCGQNHGQHIYYTLPSGSERRELDELPSTKSIRLSVRLRGGDAPRLWLLRLTQLPLAHSAPHDCLQYYTAENGTIRTFNYASNGRYLSGHEYRACVRRAPGHCSVRYAPCHARSFRVGASDYAAGPGAYGGAGTGFYGPEGAFVPDPGQSMSTTTAAPSLGNQTNAPNATNTIQEQMPAANPTEDVIEGSGADPGVGTSDDAGELVSSTPQPSFMSKIWSFIWPSWGQGRAWGWRWSPYSQHLALGERLAYGFPHGRYGRQRCRDRLTVPCENEYFISSATVGAGVCDPHHCGDNFCPGLRHEECRVETSITPFAVSVHFGPPTYKQNPEDNIGACLRYTQIPCDT